jgi:hypothetical protein
VNKELKLYGKRGGFAIVDDTFECDDFYRWRQNSRGYIVANLPREYRKNQKQAILHQLVLGKKDGFMIDHINHNKLDNRLCNLRHCTNAENQHNQSISSANTVGLKGVSKSGNKYRAHIWLNKKSVKLGSFDNPIDAHNAYKRVAEERWGEYAYTG